MLPVPNQANQFYIIHHIEELQDVPSKGTPDYLEALEVIEEHELELLDKFISLKTEYKSLVLCQKVDVTTGESLNFHYLGLEDSNYSFGFNDKEVFAIGTQIKSMNLETGESQLIHEMAFPVGYKKRFFIGSDEKVFFLSTMP